MDVVVTGFDLSQAAVVTVGRERQRVVLADGVRERLEAACRTLDRAVASGAPVYCVSVGAGASKASSVDPLARERFERLLVRNSLVGQGPVVDPAAIRGTLLVIVNLLAAGRAAVRIETVQRLVAALNDDRLPPVPLLGSLGQADLAPLSHLIFGIVGDEPLRSGEAVALTSTNAFSTGLAVFALHDAQALLGTLTASAGLAFEGFRANPSPLHPAVEQVRPYAGLARARQGLERALAGSRLHVPGEPRNLQDPLSFRNAAHVLGAAHDALAHASAQLAVELNAHQSNPLVLADSGEVVSVASFEALPVALALDYARLGLAAAITSSAERVVKLLQRSHSGLPSGLRYAPVAELALEVFATAAVALAGEARLLAAPVSNELPSTSLEDGIEDRMTFAPLAARRLAEQVELGTRIAAIELICAGEAIEIRRALGQAVDPLGEGARQTLALLRRHLEPVGPLGDVPTELEPLLADLRGGALA
ncbi:MAG TPA: aromatic amino acid lyase [Gaiellales bacterium]|jgi:histidine ammonia-lyase